MDITNAEDSSDAIRDLADSLDCILDGREHTVMIVAAPAEVVGQGEKAAQKVVLTLAKPNGKPLKQKLPLNKTNALLLASVFGPNTNNWAGRSILLRPEKALMNGGYVDCIRCYVAPDSLGAKPVPSPVPAAAVVQGGPLDGDDVDGDLESDELV